MDNAFEKARQAYGTGAYDDATLEFLFPQLRESEDERIRKELIEFLREAYSKGNAPEECAKWLVWLDQPKEQKPAEKSSTLQILKEHLANTPREQLDAEFEALKDLTIDKPAEWSEEDERMWKSALWHIKNSCSNGGKNSGEFEVYQWFENRLKLLRPQSHWKPSEYTLSLVKKVASGEMLTHMEQMAMETLCDDLQKL